MIDPPCVCEYNAEVECWLAKGKRGMVLPPVSRVQVENQASELRSYSSGSLCFSARDPLLALSCLSCWKEMRLWETDIA